MIITKKIAYKNYETIIKQYSHSRKILIKHIPTIPLNHLTFSSLEFIVKTTNKNCYEEKKY